MTEAINKKDLKQIYKNSPTTAGIYLITHTQSGHKLLGSAANAQGVLNRHLFELKFGQHRNKELQQAWNQYGEPAFEFSVLERVKPDEKNINAALEKLLEVWQQKLRIADEPRG
ncbi:GIY-YIG nuclease family protein [Cedecea davisae]|uniref:GIY-YIG nuclease family protein n=1 Tax=Cedecea davisae TaxID=158484 RepID=UPI001D0B6704|nr:GIY-YIG nuclease family protein [Cedecea davisae]